jgi:hypothetical protein
MIDLLYLIHSSLRVREWEIPGIEGPFRVIECGENSPQANVQREASMDIPKTVQILLQDLLVCKRTRSLQQPFNRVGNMIVIRPSLRRCVSIEMGQIVYTKVTRYSLDSDEYNSESIQCQPTLP